MNWINQAKKAVKTARETWARGLPNPMLLRNADQVTESILATLDYLISDRSDPESDSHIGDASRHAAIGDLVRGQRVILRRIEALRGALWNEIVGSNMVTAHPRDVDRVEALDRAFVDSLRDGDGEITPLGEDPSGRLLDDPALCKPPGPPRCGVKRAPGAEAIDRALADFFGRLPSERAFGLPPDGADIPGQLRRGAEAWRARNTIAGEQVRFWHAKARERGEENKRLRRERDDLVERYRNGTVAQFDDGSELRIVGWAGAGSKGGDLCTITAEHVRADGKREVIHYVRAAPETAHAVQLGETSTPILLDVGDLAARLRSVARTMRAVMPNLEVLVTAHVGAWEKIVTEVECELSRAPRPPAAPKAPEPQPAQRTPDHYATMRAARLRAIAHDARSMAGMAALAPDELRRWLFSLADLLDVEAAGLLADADPHPSAVNSAIRGLAELRTLAAQAVAGWSVGLDVVTPMTALRCALPAPLVEAAISREKERAEEWERERSAAKEPPKKE